MKDAAKDVAEDVTKDVAEDVLGLEGSDGVRSKSKSKLSTTHHHHRRRRHHRHRHHHLLLQIFQIFTQPFRRQKEERCAAARGDSDASPTPDEARSAAKVASGPTPNTRVPPHYACP